MSLGLPPIARPVGQRRLDTIQPRRYGPDLGFELHDPPGIALEFLGKRPGPELTVEESELDFGVRAAERDKLLAPYERLFHDALVGDQTLFTRADGVERVWEVAAPLLKAPPAPVAYAQGSWGPDAAERLTGRRGWELSARQ